MADRPWGDPEIEDIEDIEDIEPEGYYDDEDNVDPEDFDVDPEDLDVDPEDLDDE